MGRGGGFVWSYKVGAPFGPRYQAWGAFARVTQGFVDGLGRVISLLPRAIADCDVSDWFASGLLHSIRQVRSYARPSWGGTGAAQGVFPLSLFRPLHVQKRI